MSRARVVRRRSNLAEAVERAAVVERPVVCRGPLYLVQPTVTAACAGSLQRIAVLLRDESYPIASSVLDAVEVFICDGASPFFGPDAALAQREAAILQHLVETGQRTLRRYGRSSACCRVVRLAAAVGTVAVTTLRAYLIRNCRLKRRWFGDRTRSSAPRSRRIVRTKTPSSFVSRSGLIGFQTFFWSTSSR